MAERTHIIILCEMDKPRGSVMAGGRAGGRGHVTVMSQGLRGEHMGSQAARVLRGSCSAAWESRTQWPFPQEAQPGRCGPDLASDSDQICAATGPDQGHTAPQFVAIWGSFNRMKVDNLFRRRCLYPCYFFIFLFFTQKCKVSS